MMDEDTDFSAWRRMLLSYAACSLSDGRRLQQQ